MDKKYLTIASKERELEELQTRYQRSVDRKRLYEDQTSSEEIQRWNLATSEMKDQIITLMDEIQELKDKK